MMRAQEQLARASFWLGKYIPIPPEKIHVRIIPGEELREIFPQRK
jgi:hypothetical protein